MINIGDIVISIMGHDRGEYYLVLDCDNDFVYLADGRLKTVNKPKKKNKKHISRLGKCDEFIDIKGMRWKTCTTLMPDLLILNPNH